MNKIKLTVLFVMATIPAMIFAQGWSLQVSGQYGIVRYGDFNNYADYWNSDHDASLYPRMDEIHSMIGGRIDENMGRMAV